ncbi:MAG: hypothetical protein CL910_12325 [Deltaproteobacteria bacterium]|jgi:hypothetical protein|nr:hypothetical protein [Deltaproteobacteria bacterium]
MGEPGPGLSQARRVRLEFRAMPLEHPGKTLVLEARADPCRGLTRPLAVLGVSRAVPRELA